MPPRIEIIGDAEKAAPFIIWAKREWSLREGRWFKHTGTCLIELFRAGDMGFIRLIPETVSGIVGVPRSNNIIDMPYNVQITDQVPYHDLTQYAKGVEGGWVDGYVTTSTKYVFPLLDDDRTSFLIESKDYGEFLYDLGNYGNLYWWNNSTEEPIFLSWKGTPTRHFPVPPNINLEGVSSLEHTVSTVYGDIYQYTTFGSKVYKNGEVYLEAPTYSWSAQGEADTKCLVLGACINKTDDLVYAAMLSVRRFPGGVNRLVLFREGSSFDGWDLISEIEYDQGAIPFFGNSDGTSLVSIEGDIVHTSGDFIRGTDNGFGIYNEQATSTGVVEGSNSHSLPVGTLLYDVNDFSASATMERDKFYEFHKNDLVQAVLSARVDSKSNNRVITPSTKSSTMVVPVVLPAGFSTGGVISVPDKNATNDGFEIGGVFTVDWFTDVVGCNGEDCIWSISGTTVEPVESGYGGCSVRVVSSECCGTCEILVTRGAFSASAVVLFVGQWEIVSSNNYPPCQFYTWNTSVIDGGTKVDYQVALKTANWQRPCYDATTTPANPNYECLYPSGTYAWSVSVDPIALEGCVSDPQLGTFRCAMYHNNNNLNNVSDMTGVLPEYDAPIGSMIIYRWVC